MWRLHKIKDDRYLLLCFGVGKHRIPGHPTVTLAHHRTQTNHLRLLRKYGWIDRYAAVSPFCLCVVQRELLKTQPGTLWTIPWLFLLSACFILVFKSTLVPSIMTNLPPIPRAHLIYVLIYLTINNKIYYPLEPVKLIVDHLLYDVLIIMRNKWWIT